MFFHRNTKFQTFGTTITNTIQTSLFHGFEFYKSCHLKQKNVVKRLFVSSSQQSAEAWPENWSDTGHDGGCFYHLQSPQSDPQCVRGMLTVTLQHTFQKIMFKIHI